VASVWPERQAAAPSARNIGDFRKWKDHDAYKQCLARALRDLTKPLNPDAVPLSKSNWEQINCTIFEDMRADEAELAEIDENLIRAELSPAERALHIGKRKELYEKVHPETKTGGAPGKAGGGKKAKTCVLCRS
jgi:hypothetical protein